MLKALLFFGIFAELKAGLFHHCCFLKSHPDLGFSSKISIEFYRATSFSVTMVV